MLTNAIDTEGVLPGRADNPLDASIKLSSSRSDHDQGCPERPLHWKVGRYTLFGPLASIVNILVRNPMTPVRLESIDCRVEIEPGRKTAVIESVRLLSDAVQPGQDLKAFITVKPTGASGQSWRQRFVSPRIIPKGLTRSSSVTWGTVSDADSAMSRP